MKIRKKRSEMRIPVMRGRKGNLKCKRWGSKKCRKLHLDASIEELKAIRKNSEKNH